MSGKKIALWGWRLSQKRMILEAPSKYIIDRLVKHGAEVSAYDPIASENFQHYLKKVAWMVQLTSAKAE